MTASQQNLPDPVFIGGMARSGTHACGHLVAAHPYYHFIPLEVRIHSEREGLPDLLAGKVDLARFMEKCRGLWWRRGIRNTRGLHTIVSKEELEAALGEFEASFEGDRLGASRRLVRSLLDPIALRAGSRSWVEVTGKNITSAPTLVELFPTTKVVHMVRDGRDVAASLVNRPWGTDSWRVGLDHWDKRLRAAERATRKMPAGSVLVMRLEDLVTRDREASLRRLVDFLELEDDVLLRTHFDRNISSGQANLGRWRTDMSKAEQRKIDLLYGRLVRNLNRDGVSCAPPPEEAGVSDGLLRRGAERVVAFKGLRGRGLRRRLIHSRS